MANRRNTAGGGHDEAPIVLYTTPDGAVKVNVYFRDGNLWLPQAGIAELFGVQKAAVSKHLKNIFAEGELNENAVVSKMETTAADGKKYSVAYYGIKAIIAVGYRVNSERATAFRIWATDTLEEFVRKGFVLNDEMLKMRVKFRMMRQFEGQTSSMTYSVCARIASIFRNSTEHLKSISKANDDSMAHYLQNGCADAHSMRRGAS